MHITIRRFSFFLFCAAVMIGGLLLCSAQAEAASYSGTCGADGDNLTWILDEEGTLTISGVGEMAQYTDRKATPWYSKYGTKILRLVVESGVTSIGYAAFEYCTNLESVSLPGTVTTIASQAFNRCTGLKEIAFSEGLTTIGSYAFYECSGLTEIYLPASIVSIDSQVFSMCTALTGIWVNENNSVYQSDDKGVLYSKADNLLVQAPGELSGSYTIPDGVVGIGDSAFYSCSKLTELVIPDGVSKIDYQAMCYCTGLKSVTIPVSVTTIGSYAFYDCTGLTDVYYGSAEADKAAITISSGNTPLNNAAWHYTDPYALVFAGASVVLYNDLSINFKVSSALLSDCGYTDPYVVFDFDGQQTTVTAFSEKDGKHIFTFSNIAPNQLGQPVTATLYATREGQLCQSEAVVYSVKDYCYNTLDTYSEDKDTENAYGELRTLLVDLLRYGTASQLYTGVDTDTLVNAALTETQQAWGTSTEPSLASVLDREYATVTGPLVNWRGAGLALQDSVLVRVKFAADSTEGLAVRVTLDDVTYSIGADRFVPTGTQGVYYVYFDKLSASQMRQAIYITAYKEGVAVSDTLRYSVESYAYTYQSNSNSQLAELVKVMIRYGDAAYAFVN